MARLKNDNTGVVVNTSDEVAERLPTGWSAESEKSGTSSKSSGSGSSRKSTSTSSKS